MISKQTKIRFLIPLMVLFLAACGGESGTESNSENSLARVETIYDLGECETLNEGVMKRVDSERRFYTCRKGVWQPETENVSSGNGSGHNNNGISSDDSFPFNGNRFETESQTSSSQDTRSSSSIVSSSSPKIESSGIMEESVYDSKAHTLTDLRDGHIYRTFDHRGKVWMAENLNYRYLGPTATNDSSSFCLHDDFENCNKYGRLYLFSAAIDSAGLISDHVVYNYSHSANYAPDGSFECWSGGGACYSEVRVQGICPHGWHLLSNRDISELDTLDYWWNNDPPYWTNNLSINPDGYVLANWLEEEEMFHALWGGSRRAEPYEEDRGCHKYYNNDYESEDCTGWWFTSGNFEVHNCILPKKFVLERMFNKDTAYVSTSTLFGFNEQTNTYRHSGSAYYVRCIKD